MNDLITTNGMNPTSFDELMRLGAVLAKSGFFKDTKTEAEAVAKIVVGMELGISPTAALRSVHVFNGQIALHYSLIAALIKGSGKYDYRVIERTPAACEIDFFENGEKVGTVRKTMQEMDDRKVSHSWDNKTNKWKKKYPWQAFPDTMLFARALTDGQRTYCPEVGNGPLYTPDEFDETPPMNAVMDEGGETVEQGAVIVSVEPLNGFIDLTDLRNELGDARNELRAAGREPRPLTRSEAMEMDRERLEVEIATTRQMIEEQRGSGPQRGLV